jgi:hypothetical protein
MLVEKNNISEIATYQGQLNKSIAQMTLKEQKEHYKFAEIRAREYLFSIGQPLVHQKDGHVVAEYSNGKIVIIK